jgi:hypothetical protein
VDGLTITVVLVIGVLEMKPWTVHAGAMAARPVTQMEARER